LLRTTPIDRIDHSRDRIHIGVASIFAILQTLTSSEKPVMKKAAVVIGVGKTGNNLTPLRSAVSGAEEIAAWLKDEEYDAVVCITDQDAAVTCDRIESEIAALVTVPPTYHLLVVYFSGHGYWQARSDIWLLSGAPVRPSEAINLEAAMDMARYSGIKNIVFISDACRSIPDSRSGARVEGRSAFPNFPDVDAISKIDYFKATSDALPAYEGPIGGAVQSVLTHALLSAYENPEAHMVREIAQGDETIRVVPNRRLEHYLQKRVDEILAQIDPGLSQRVEANVPSSEDVYISRVRGTLRSGPEPPGAVRSAAFPGAEAYRGPLRAHDPAREAAEALARALQESALAPATWGVRPGGDSLHAKADARTEKRARERLPDSNLAQLVPDTAIVVQGARVKRVLAPAPDVAQPQLVDPGDGGPSDAIVRLHGVTPQSIVLQIENDRCVILAHLPGFIAHASFDAEGLSNVSYVPSPNTSLWRDYQRIGDELDRVRAFVAVAVEGDAFRIPSGREADLIYMMVHAAGTIDPTLGLYAAYAFSRSSYDAHVESIGSAMRRDLQAELYDVRMLSTRRSQTDVDAPVVPFVRCSRKAGTFSRLVGSRFPEFSRKRGPI
jgi:hypothetical protein